MEPRFELAEETDIILLTTIMVHSFDYYAHRYRGTPAKHPLVYSSGGWLREWLATGTVFKILTNHTFTGGFIISLNLPKPYWNYLAPIFINLPYQKQTIGSSTLQCIERTFPAYRWQAMPPPAWVTQIFRITKNPATTSSKKPSTPKPNNSFLSTKKPCNN